VFNGYDNLLKDKKAAEKCLYALKAQATQGELEKLTLRKRELVAQREQLQNKKFESSKDEGDAKEKSAVDEVRTEIA